RGGSGGLARRHCGADWRWGRSAGMGAVEAGAVEEQEGGSPGGLLGWIERVGNKVPHPVVIFLYLIVVVMVLSAVLDLLNVGITDEVLVPKSPQIVEAQYVGGTIEPTGVIIQEQSTDYVIKEQTVAVRSLLSIEGIRFIFTSFVSNFANFTVVATIFVAMIG